jgi:uncharacterized protein (DUF1330 family)
MSLANARWYETYTNGAYRVVERHGRRYLAIPGPYAELTIDESD